MHPEITPTTALKIMSTPASKGAHTKQSVSTSKGVQEQPIATCTQSQQFTPTSIPYNPQQDAPVASHTRSRLRTAHLLTPTRAQVMAENHLAHHHVGFPVLDKETGKLLNYGQLKIHPLYSDT